MRNNRIPTVLGLLLLIGGIASGLFLIQNPQIFKTGATSDPSPKNVRITNVSDSSFTISWTTDKETLGFVTWGQSETSLERVSLDKILEENFTHAVILQGLDASTTYYFEIGSGETSFDNNDVSWKGKTGVQLGTTPQPMIISGSVISATGKPVKNALVYTSLVNGTVLSEITSENGSWVIPLSLTRNQSLDSYLRIENESLIEITVQAGPFGVSSAKIFPASADPTPALILGQIHDFRNIANPGNENIPSASLGLPTAGTASAGFDVSGKDPLPNEDAVTLESIDEGEIVVSADPEFFGTGPAGTTLTITVESDPVTKEVVIDTNGDWDLSLLESLEEGIHKITISWKDSGGILRTLTRNFIVQASEGPAFEATPSASPTGSPAGSPTSTPTSTPSGTAIPTGSATPTSSPSAIPDSGSLTPTVMLTIMGLGLIVFSSVVWKLEKKT